MSTVAILGLGAMGSRMARALLRASLHGTWPGGRGVPGRAGSGLAAAGRGRRARLPGGGDPGTLARAAPVLGAMGGAIRHVGPAGQGMALKLAVNALFAAQVAALAELLGLLRRAGVDQAAAVASPALKGAAGQMLARSFAPLFPDRPGGEGPPVPGGTHAAWIRTCRRRRCARSSRGPPVPGTARTISRAWRSCSRSGPGQITHGPDATHRASARR